MFFFLCDDVCMLLWKEVIVGWMNTDIQFMPHCLKCRSCVLAETKKSGVALIASPFGRHNVQFKVGPMGKVSDS